MPAVRLSTTSTPESRMRSTDLCVQLGRPGTLAGLRVADVDVVDRGAGLCGIDRRVGDLLGRDGHVRALADCVAGTR